VKRAAYGKTSHFFAFPYWSQTHTGVIVVYVLFPVEWTMGTNM
jgi:hypothetical protein